MGYTFNCDGPCGKRYDKAPPFMGEFRETFLKTRPSVLTEMFTPGETVTLCEDCSEAVFASATFMVCIRCGWHQNALTLPDGVDECPRCENSDFRFVPPDHPEVDV